MTWYHCGRCGLLFKSPAGDANDRRCSKCGRDPSLGVEALSERSLLPASAAVPSATEASHPRSIGATYRPQRRFLMAKILVGWVLAMGLIVLAVRLIWPEETARTPANATAVTVKGTSGDEAVVHLNKALPACYAAFGGFLAAATPAERNQFVLNPVATAGRMARFYDLNPAPRIDPQAIKNMANSLLDLPAGRAVESRWVATDGRTLDCVFVQQNGEWRLDWDHFARYCDYPWSLFLTGAGDPELDFRLLARERRVKEGGESSHMTVVFYAPRFGHPDQAGTTSPDFLVKRDSDDGRLLAAAFKKHAKGEPLFGSKLPYLEPPDMLRVRVRLRRLPADSDSTFNFELVKVLACHWMAIDDPGVQPPPEATPPPP